MTNEEAIQLLKHIEILKFKDKSETYMFCDILDAFELAIKALEFMDKLSKRDIERFNEMEYTKGYNKGWKDGRKALEQQPCEDAISREAVLDIINNPLNIRIDEIIEKLPPVAPQPKIGHWIRRDYWSEGVGMGESYGYYYQCSECEEIIQGGYMKCDSKYCPNCGAKMESEEEI